MAQKIVEYLLTDLLYPNPANPPSRTDLGNLSSLTKSIRGDGLQYPILVSKDGEGRFQIIDGHRRYTVLKSDKHETVPCIVADGNAGHLYAMVNGTAKPLTGKDWAYVFISPGGRVPNGVTHNNLKRLAQLIGNDGIRWMADEGLSPGVYQTARRVAKYVDGNADNDERLTEIVKWLIRNRQTAACLAIINNQQDAAMIGHAIKNDTKIVAV